MTGPAAPRALAKRPPGAYRDRRGAVLPAVLPAVLRPVPGALLRPVPGAMLRAARRIA
jgi:hypothetical protein